MLSNKTTADCFSVVFDIDEGDQDEHLDDDFSMNTLSICECLAVADSPMNLAPGLADIIPEDDLNLL